MENELMQQYEGGEESQYSGKTPAQWQKYWGKEIKAAQRRLRQFHKRGDDITSRFIDERDGSARGTEGYESYSLNLFHSNISTLQSMLYGSTPKVDVAREYHDPDDDVARVAGLMFERILQADVEPSGSDFPTVLQSCLQDRLLPGLGVARVRYEPITEEQPVVDPMGQPVYDENGEPLTQEVLVSEEAPIDYVHWSDFLWSWGRTWSELHWVGFRSWLDKEQAAKRFGEDIAKALTYSKQTPDADQDSVPEQGADQESVTQKAEVWEIWCKHDNYVYWYAPGQDTILDRKRDPLGLDGFYPIPKPMIANQTTKLVIPTADFIIAQDLYNQIDELYTRITVITRAIKVVGVYDEAAGQSVGRMLKEGQENDLIPVENWAMFAEAGGLRGKIDWFPAEQVVGTLQTLKAVLDEQIALLQQVTGMADIMRGQSQQYAGVGQEQLKAQFGSIRVQALQDDFARFASDLESLKAEVISKHFEMRTIAQQSSAEFLPRPDQQLINPALELMKSPDMKWRINIKPESIAMVDYQNLKSEKSEFIMSVSQFIQSSQGMIEAVPGSTPVLLEMLKWSVAGLKGADYLEGILDQGIQLAQQAAQNPQQEGPSQEEIKARTEQLKSQTALQKAQMDLQKVQMKSRADLMQLQMKIQGEMARLQKEMETEVATQDQTYQNRMTELMQEFDNDLRLIQAQLQADVRVEEAQSAYAIAEEEAGHENTMEQLQAQRSMRGV